MSDNVNHFWEYQLILIQKDYHMNQCLGRHKSAENSDILLVNVNDHLLGNVDTANRAENSEKSDNQAKKPQERKLLKQ